MNKQELDDSVLDSINKVEDKSISAIYISSDGDDVVIGAKGEGEQLVNLLYEALQAETPIAEAMIVATTLHAERQYQDSNYKSN